MERNSQALKTALLVMDIQTATLAMLPDTTALKATTSEAIAAARKAKMQIIYVVVGFRAGFPEVGPDNKSFSAIRQRPGVEALIDVTVDPSIDLQPEDIVVTKRRVSAFAGSDLEVILRAHRFDHLVLTGIATSGVVLSTLREAADKDYRLSVLSDACADLDAEVHNVLLTKVFPRQAEVLTVRQWADGLA